MLISHKYNFQIVPTDTIYFTSLSTKRYYLLYEFTYEHPRLYLIVLFKIRLYEYNLPLSHGVEVYFSGMLVGTALLVKLDEQKRSEISKRLIYTVDFIIWLNKL